MSGRRPRIESEQAAPEDAEGETAAPQKERLRDKEFWFEDGTIVLIAGNIEFRVYKGWLASHSPVFSDMFSLPQPPLPEGQTEECPLVHLTDSPEDLRHILRTYMPNQTSNVFGTRHPNFNTISASIRLGHKYDMAHLQEQALNYLKDYFTSDYDDYQGIAHLPPSFEMRHAIGVVNLARLIGDMTLLPTALLCCMRLGSAIVDGFEREDGSMEYLTQEDLGRCFEAFTCILGDNIISKLCVFSFNCSEECWSPETCIKHFQSSLRSLVTGMKKFSGRSIQDDPFIPCAAIVDTSKLGICSWCLTTFHERDRRDRLSLWSRLPTVLNLQIDGWPQHE